MYLNFAVFEKAPFNLDRKTFLPLQLYQCEIKILEEA